MPESGVRPGDLLPGVSFPLTLQRMVMIASANRDFAPIHIDRQYARESGADDAYTNMMFIMAMMERTTQEWRSAARLRALRGLRMVAFNRVGDVVTCRGRVTAADDLASVEIEMWLETAVNRQTATATAVVDLRPSEQ
jgi:acyl dehydratase